MLDYAPRGDRLVVQLVHGQRLLQPVEVQVRETVRDDRDRRAAGGVRLVVQLVHGQLPAHRHLEGRRHRVTKTSF